MWKNTKRTGKPKEGVFDLQFLSKQDMINLINARGIYLKNIQKLKRLDLCIEVIKLRKNNHHAPPPRPPSPPPRPPPPKSKRSTPQKTPSSDATEETLKYHYNEVIKTRIESNKPIDRTFVLLNFHPDKLPLHLKQLLEDDRYIAIRASRVFDALNKISRMRMVDSSDMKNIIIEVFEKSPRSKPKPPPPKSKAAPKKCKTVFIVGMGCMKADLPNTGEIQYECNEVTKDILKNVARVVCYMKPNHKSVFIQDLYARVKADLQIGQQVLLVGHSWGGAAACTIAELLNNESANTLSYLRVVTMGSIYISPVEKTNNIDILHYMMKDDVALKCNKLNQPKGWKDNDDIRDNIKHIIWVKSKNFKKTKSWTFNPFGKTSQWDIHNDYHEIFKMITC